MITPAAPVPTRRLRAATTSLGILGLLLSSVPPALAQSDPGRPSRWEFLVSSGKLLPVGAQRVAIARGGVTAAQLSFVPGPVAVTATVGWARSRDVAAEGRPRLDAFLYDIGAELRMPRVHRGSWSLMPFGGAGVGVRSYNYRSLDVDATHNPAAFLSAGGVLGVGRVRLRLELRDYLTGFRPLEGPGAADTRNDLVLMAGVRLAPRR